jgi:hypothetical protein
MSSTAVEAVRSEADRFAANVRPIIREAHSKGWREDAEGDCIRFECPRCHYGMGWPMARYLIANILARS